MLPLLVLAAPFLVQVPAGNGVPLPPWNERTIRHLYARAGFGASAEELDAALEAGPAATVASLMHPRRPWTEVDPVLVPWEEFGLGPDQIPLKTLKYASPEEALAARVRWRAVERTQFTEYAERWFRSMLAHDDPLRDHVTLFWHGLFTTSLYIVKRKYEIIEQHQWLRRESLGSFSRLLHGLVRDPAMLQYLDNNTNVRGHPNENLARELMELFSLGEGHYTEVDVREAARALTGNSSGPEGRFSFIAERHDGGPKTILQQSGAFGSEELADILLAQPACATFIAGRLLEYFEGAPPDAARLREYAAFLRDHGYELQPWFEKLFLDPRFYRDEVLGARVQGPIEFLVGVCRKLEIDPPPGFVREGAALLGQMFYGPPTVRGWDEGLGWITNDSLMQRGNIVGVLLGILFLDEPAADRAGMEPSAARSEQDASMQPAATTELGATVRRMVHVAGLSTWRPQVDLVSWFEVQGARTDAQIVDAACAHWLDVPVDAPTRAALLEFLAKERASAVQQPDAATAWEIALRRFARLVFSLPEAQLS